MLSREPMPRWDLPEGTVPGLPHWEWSPTYTKLTPYPGRLTTHGFQWSPTRTKTETHPAWNHAPHTLTMGRVGGNFLPSSLFAFQPDCGVTEGGETPTTEKTAENWRCFLIGWPPQPANAPRVHSQPKLANTHKGVSAWAINWAPLLPKDNTFSQAENGGPHPGDPGTKMLF